MSNLEWLRLRDEASYWWVRWNELRVEKCERGGIEPYPQVRDVEREPEKYEGYL